MPSGKKSDAPSLADMVDDVMQEAEERRRDVLKTFAQAAVLDEAGGVFRGEGNPVVIWLAIGYCLRNDLPLPDWVQGYLVRAADDIAALAEGADSKAAENVGGALGFGRERGQSSVFSQFQKWHQRAEIGRSYAMKVLDGTKPYLAEEEVAGEMGISKSTVRRRVEQFYGRKKVTREVLEEFSKYQDFMTFLSK